MVVADFFQITGYLDFYLIGEILLIFYLTIQLSKSLFVRLFKELANHREHLLHTLTKLCRFLLSLQDSDFWRLYQVRLNVLQMQLLLFWIFTLWQ